MLIRAIVWSQQPGDWLHTRRGYPCNILFAVGLVGEIIERARRFPEMVPSAAGKLRLGPLIELELALLIHHVVVLSRHVERRSALMARKS